MPKEKLKSYVHAASHSLRKICKYILFSSCTQSLCELKRRNFVHVENKNRMNRKVVDLKTHVKFHSTVFINSAVSGNFCYARNLRVNKQSVQADSINIGFSPSNPYGIIAIRTSFAALLKIEVTVVNLTEVDN